MAAACLLAVPLWVNAGDLEVDNLTLYGKLEFANETVWPASGGTVTTNGNYVIHTFTTVGTDSFIVASGSITCDVLVVAGGGGGSGGAGGAGGVLCYTSLVVSATNTVTVGGGGSGAGHVTGNGANGGNSSFGAQIAYGGGGGGKSTSTPRNGVDGGSGGGAGAHNTTVYSGGAGTNGQGFAGGNNQIDDPYATGGGGGAGAAGGNATSAVGGNGGIGISNNMSGVMVGYAGGGGGGTYLTGGTAGTASYGGGSGGVGADGNDGSDNTGGGGGGSGNYGGNGGSGVVIVRYLNSTSTNAIASINGINQIGASATNIFMGKVGIGTNIPAEKLHVAGNVRVDGTNMVSALTLGGESRTNWPTVIPGTMVTTNNLADVSDPAAARSNLFLGSAATNQSQDFLTPAGNGSQLTGITASQVGALSIANNLSDVYDPAVARSNLQLGSAATNQSQDFLIPTGNGSQLTGITADQVGALSVTGGVVNGDITINGALMTLPIGDLPMGTFTNQ